MKYQYIDNVKKAQDETRGLFNNLNTKPPSDLECSELGKKRNTVSERKLRAFLTNRSIVSKRILISGLTDLVRDAASLLSCAIEMLDNLAKTVELPEPPIGEIEYLTNELQDIGDDLQKEETDPSDSASSSNAPSTSNSRSSSPSSTSCSVRTVSQCTEAVSLSTSSISDDSANHTVVTSIRTICTTATGCSVSATTISTTTSSSGSPSEGYCAPTCSACTDSLPPEGTGSTSMNTRRGDSYDKRTLEIPELQDNLNQYMMQTSKSAFFAHRHAHCSLSLASFSPGRTSHTFRANKLMLVLQEGTIDLIHRVTGKLSSALTSSWDSSPKHLLVSGLYGCTPVQGAQCSGLVVQRPGLVQIGAGLVVHGPFRGWTGPDQ